jgi:predicted ATP-dependent protease
MREQSSVSVPPDALAKRASLTAIPFDSTDQCADPLPIIGQARAQAALELLLDMRWSDYHAFVLMQKISTQAEPEGIALVQTSLGFSFAPLLNTFMEQRPQREREMREKIRALFRETTSRVVKHRVADLAQRYADLPQVIAHLGEVEKDILENAREIVALGPGAPEDAPIKRYAVNAFVVHDPQRGAPIIEEPHPTLQNLLGRIAHRSIQGTLVTDFTLITAGALQRASGGCLILEADKILRQPFSWDALERALRSEEVHRLFYLLDALDWTDDNTARAGDAKKLSVHMRELCDRLREADHEAAVAKSPRITRRNVEDALAARIKRLDRLRERSIELVKRGTVLIDLEKQVIGQVNALAVAGLGSFAFGHPSRVTARHRLGRGNIVDIEREVELGGALRSKGVLILAGYLGARFATDRPLSLSASLVLEQSYSPVEGDSASLAELCALLSSLANVPIEQALAVTDSVNQLGRVQPVGGAHEKVEGFFDVCRAVELTGEQGVIIPRANVDRLMLDARVVAAVREERFRVLAVDTVDQAMELLTGIPAGERDLEGFFPHNTINHRIEARLIALADASVRFECR